MAANTEFGKRSRRIRTSDRLSDLLLWIIVLVWFLPAFWIILTSVRARTEVDALPPVWIPRVLSFDSYKILFGMPTPEGAFGLGGYSTKTENFSFDDFCFVSCFVFYFDSFYVSF